jgi:hypothetical protein
MKIQRFKKKNHDALPIQELKNPLKLLYSLSIKKKLFNNLTSNFSHEIFQSGILLPLPLSESHNIWIKTNDIIAFKFVSKLNATVFLIITSHIRRLACSCCKSVAIKSNHIL